MQTVAPASSLLNKHNVTWQSEHLTTPFAPNPYNLNSRTGVVTRIVPQSLVKKKFA